MTAKSIVKSPSATTSHPEVSFSLLTLLALVPRVLKSINGVSYVSSGELVELLSNIVGSSGVNLTPSGMSLMKALTTLMYLSRE